MSKVILIHYSEIGLKRGNRRFFEDKLVDNIKAAIKPCGSFQVKRVFGRMIIEGEVAKNWLQLKDRLQKVFGIANFTLAERCCFVCHPESEQQPGPRIPAVLTKIERVLDKEFLSPFLALPLKKGEGNVLKSFRITARRAQKEFPLTSQELNEKLGAFVQEKTGAKVDLKNPEVNFYVEIVNKEAFLYCDFKDVGTRRASFLQGNVNRGPGGLPVSSSGRALCLISGGIDSPVAAWLMMKRGLQLNFIHFHSAPQTDIASQEKVKEIVKILNGWQCNPVGAAFMAARGQASPKFRSGGISDGQAQGLPLQMIPFLSFQKKVLTKTPAKYRVILYRREMLRQAEKIAKKIKAQALITGESLGQVASQTIENIAVIEQAVNLPILRPLIGFDKQEIINLAQKINTYNISIEPHQDCCSLFVPQHPATRADLKRVKQAEKLIEP